MTSSFTPGPWHIMGHAYWVGPNRDVQVADLLTDLNKDMPEPERIANAKLIAAAPDLLAALKFALTSPDEDAAIKMAEAAIAKAEGKAS